MDVAAGVGDIETVLLLRSYGADCEDAYGIAIQRGHTVLASRLLAEQGKASTPSPAEGNETSPARPATFRDHADSSVWGNWSPEQRQAVSRSIEDEVIRRAQSVLRAT